MRQTQSPHQPTCTKRRKEKERKEKVELDILTILSNNYFDYKNMCCRIWPWAFLGHLKYGFIHKNFMDIHSLGKLEIVVQCKAQLYLGIDYFFQKLLSEYLLCVRHCAKYWGYNSVSENKLLSWSSLPCKLRYRPKTHTVIH